MMIGWWWLLVAAAIAGWVGYRVGKLRALAIFKSIVRRDGIEVEVRSCATGRRVATPQSAARAAEWESLKRTTGCAAGPGSHSVVPCVRSEG